MIQYTKATTVIKKVVLDTTDDSSITRRGSEFTLNIEPTHQDQPCRIYGIVQNKFPRVGDWCIQRHSRLESDIVQFDSTMNKDEYYTVIFSSNKADNRFRHYSLHDVITFIEKNDGIIINHVIANCSKNSLYPDIER